MKNVKEYKQIDPDDIIFSQVLLDNIQRYDVVAICGTEINLFDLEDGEKVVKGDGENYSILLTPKKPKLMSFNQARAKLREITPKGFYISVNFDIIDHPSGTIKTSCSLQTGDRSGVFGGKTFEACFIELERITKEESDQITEDIIPEG